MEPNWYASIGGIVLFTLAIVQGLKSWLGDSEHALAKVPTTVYVVITSLLLTVVANKVLGTLPSDNFAQLLVDALTAALGAVGVFEALRPSNVTKSIADSGKKLLVLLALSSAALTSACASGGALAPTVANYGARITELAMQAQDVVIQADKSGLQPNKDLTAKAQVRFRELGVVLQKLATGLRAYDALSDAQKAESSGQIRELLLEARKLTRAVMAFTGGNETLGSQLLDLFSNLDRLFDEVSQGLKAA